MKETEINEIKEGDILHTSWGYDQTNNDYCKVLENTGKTLKCVMIGSDIIKHTGYLSETVRPNPDKLDGSKPFRIRIVKYKYNGEERFSLSGSYPFCWNDTRDRPSKRLGYWWLWNGQDNHESHYH